MRLVVVSNRVSPRSGGIQPGGLTVGLEAALAAHGGIWFGWSGRLVDGKASPCQTSTAKGICRITIDLPRARFDGFYNGFSNQCLWPLFHGRSDLVRYSISDYADYRSINSLFAAALARHLRPDDVIWIHDYHLIPLGQALRDLGIRNRIGFFLHIPFPGAAEFRTLPVHRALGQSLRAYDLVGFQTCMDRAKYLSYQRDDYLPTSHEKDMSGVFPIGIATRSFEALASTASISSEPLKGIFQGLPPNVRTIIGVDRLDYTKGLPARFAAYARLLSRSPELASTTRFVQVAPVGRQDVPAYRQEARRVHDAAADINRRFGCPDRHPVHLVSEAVSRHDLAAAYRRSRIGLVTPIRDGMNLVAKEYVAAQDPGDPGVLILSRTAGAAEELTDALLVDATDTAAVVAALEKALTMPLTERRRRWSAMISVLRRNDAAMWSKTFLDHLLAVEQHELLSAMGTAA